MRVTRFAKDTRDDQARKANYLRDYLDFVLADRRRFGMIRAWRPALWLMVSYFDQLGKQDEAVRFLEKHSARLTADKLSPRRSSNTTCLLRAATRNYSTTKRSIASSQPCPIIGDLGYLLLPVGADGRPLAMDG